MRSCEVGVFRNLLVERWIGRFSPRVDKGWIKSGFRRRLFRLMRAAKQPLWFWQVKRPGQRCLKPPGQPEPDEHGQAEHDLGDRADQHAHAGADPGAH